MQKPSEPRDPRPVAGTPARREWSKPVLVAYGHLAKLTRGSSGNKGESGGMMPCL